MTKKLVIAIDGPSASGKGTIAKMLAHYFELPYLNTGALYRAVAWQLIKRNIALENFEQYLSQLVINIDKTDLENYELFTENVGAIASIIAKSHKFRSLLFDYQKNFVEKSKSNFNSSHNLSGCVLDGRDTTTVICPDADIKLFITADVEIRAKRRFEQQKSQSAKDQYSMNLQPFEEILTQLKLRDENDFNRSVAPLKVASDAVVIDNGNLSIEEGFNKALSIINSKISQ